MISEKEVRHIAKLARIKLSDSEVKKFTSELGDILDFFQKLQKVKTDHVAETSQVTGLENISRLDEVKMCEYEEVLLECSPQQIESHSIKVPKIM